MGTEMDHGVGVHIDPKANQRFRDLGCLEGLVLDEDDEDEPPAKVGGKRRVKPE